MHGGLESASAENCVLDSPLREVTIESMFIRALGTPGRCAAIATIQRSESACKSEAARMMIDRMTFYRSCGAEGPIRKVRITFSYRSR